MSGAGVEYCCICGAQNPPENWYVTLGVPFILLRLLQQPSCPYRGKDGSCALGWNGSVLEGSKAVNRQSCGAPVYAKLDGKTVSVGHGRHIIAIGRANVEV